MSSGVVGLLVVLLALLNVGGIIAIVLGIGRGEPRWITDLVMLVLLDAVGFTLLRAARDDS